jgi:hypothetical protein
LRQDPFSRPQKSKRSSAPRVHAVSKLVRKAMYDAYAWFVACFREAAAKLRAGDRLVKFPKGSFPPGTPVRGLGNSRVADRAGVSTSPNFRIPFHKTVKAKVSPGGTNSARQELSGSS